jgi:heavy metal sensor kinase
LNFRSIRFRLLVWYAGLLALIFLLLGGVFYLDLKHFLENDLRQTEIRRAHQVANTLLAHASQTGEAYVASQTKDWYEPEISGRFIRITRGDGTPIYVSGAPKDGAFNPAEVPAFDPAATREASRKLKMSDGKTMLIIALKFQSPGNPDYRVEFGELLDPVEGMLNRLFLQLAMGLPLALIIVTVGGYILVRRALIPVEQITHAAENITFHNLSERLPVTHTRDELERLSNSLNRMIARLDDSFNNSKRFVADASHELRTPLTVLRGELENLANDNRLNPELQERVHSLLEEAVHLSQIVEQLLTLSRLDAGEAQTDRSSLDLAKLAKSTAEQMSLLADDRKIALECQAEQPVRVEGDQVRLKQVVVNLLDNAIKYTPPRGHIQLSIRAISGEAILEVIDDGIGIPAHHLPFIFERFYRVNPTGSAYPQSAGLGLSIVKSICTAHGAKVEATSIPGAGSTFRVTLPLSKI